MNEKKTPEEPIGKQSDKDSQLKLKKGIEKVRWILLVILVGLIAVGYFTNSINFFIYAGVAFLLILFLGFIPYFIPFTPVKAALLVVGGPILFIAFVASCIVPFNQYKVRAYNSDSKANLHNLYLGCKDYWEKNGSDKECDVSKVATQQYGFVQSSKVDLEGHGTKSTFTATAQHMDSTTSYTMDANGNIE